MSLSTKTIYLKLQDTPMRTFVGNWVMFEDLLVSIHASGRMNDDDRDLLGSLRLALKHHYQQWSDMLIPYWQQVKIAGEALRQDPFMKLLETSVLGGVTGSYQAVEELSAVRLTLNLMVSDQDQ